MFKLMKYEIRKNIWGLLIFLIAIFGLEGYFLVSTLLEKQDHSFLSAVLLVLATTVSYFFVMIYAIVSYSKELNSKSSYLTFMAPVSSAKIIGSKLLTTIAMAICLVVLLMLLGYLDINLMGKAYPELEMGFSLVEMISEMSGFELRELLMDILVMVLEMAIVFLTYTSMAYFAVTLSATAFQNKKYKGIISFIIFIVVDILIGKIVEIVEMIIGLDDYVILNGLDMLLYLLPTVVVYVIFIIIALFTSAKLLDKKVSL